MIEDLVKITIDPICKPSRKPANYDQNGFELIYREDNPYC
jgi:hypothetical protein